MRLLFVDLRDDVKRFLNTLVPEISTLLQFCVVCVSVEAQDVEGVGGSDCDQGASARPVDLHMRVKQARSDQESVRSYLLRVDIDAAHDIASLPVPEQHKTTAARSQKSTTADAVDTPTTCAFHTRA